MEIATGKELEEESKTIEKDDEVTTELDNVIREEGESPDNMTEDETQSTTDAETQKKEEEEEERQDEKDEEAPEIKIDGDRLVSENNVSVNISDELASNESQDLSGVQVTDEEKEAAKETSRDPSEIFETKTGATRASQASREDLAEDLTQDTGKNGQEETDEAESDAITDTKTGAKQAPGKVKKFLFSTILGLRRAKKSIGNFFKKKLPKAFVTGAKATKEAMKYTPLAPVAHLIDYVIKKREESRPQREEQARLKKEKKEKEELEKKQKWLLDQDEKKRKKEEQERITKEKEELEKKAKAALEEAEKAQNTLKYRTKSFFKGIWGGIKTGALWIGRKVRDSKVGQFVGKAAVKTVAAVKGVVHLVKGKIGTVLDKVKGVVDQAKDEFDEYSFEDRMKRVSEEEEKKRQNGEEVPDQDYRTRYLALTEELRGKLSSIRENISRREDIENALSEMEGIESPEVELKDTGEKIDREEWQGEDRALTWQEDLADMAIECGVNTLAGETPGSEIIVNLSKIGTDSGRVNKFRQREKMMDAINSTSKDQLIKRLSRYAKDNAELKKMEAGFDIALDILRAGEGIGKVTGMGMVSGGIGLAKNITSGVKYLATSSKKRTGVKQGIKDMLGGRDGYYALKSKYKMHAPEMRRAVRDALGVATSEDAVTADKWELSHLMHERTKQGPMDLDTQRMVEEAGGTSERKFDVLQGAGGSVKRRFADRRKKMTA